MTAYRIPAPDALAPPLWPPVRPMPSSVLSHPANCHCGMCHCGCGEPAPISDRTNQTLGYVRGEPHRFIWGHSKGNWQGGRYVDSDGYVKVHAPGHPRAIRNHVYEHILIVEEALGKFLPAGAEVHHVNRDKADNRPGNLVICQDHSYHMLIHKRARALAASGHADWLWCHFCKSHDAPERIRGAAATRPAGTFHYECRLLYDRARRSRKAA